MVASVVVNGLALRQDSPTDRTDMPSYSVYTFGCEAGI